MVGTRVPVFVFLSFHPGQGKGGDVPIHVPLMWGWGAVTPGPAPLVGAGQVASPHKGQRASPAVGTG